MKAEGKQCSIWEKIGGSSRENSRLKNYFFKIVNFKNVEHTDKRLII